MVSHASDLTRTLAIRELWHCMNGAATTELGKRIFRDENCRSSASRRLSSDGITRARERCTPKFPRVPLCWWVIAVLILSPGCSNLFPTSTSGTGSPEVGQTLTQSQAAIRAARLANDECERRYEKRPFAPGQYAAVFEGDVYRWGRLDEGGHGGFSSLVTFAPDGSNPKVEVYFSTDIIRQR